MMKNMADFKKKERYDIADLLRIMEILRSPQGCPWDREQTHRSIRSDFLEETHEALEAIDSESREALCEELGDVLLQVVFHAQIEKELGGFDFDEVADGICRKLIVRHPHVFGDVQAEDSAQVLKNWDAIKRQTKGGKTQAQLLEGLPRSLPALMRAAKVQNRARRGGMDFADIEQTLAAVQSELDELKEAVRDGKREEAAEELGDLLFSAVNVSRFLKADAELSLTASTDKFVQRFARVEALAAQEGKALAECSAQELDALWARAKEMNTGGDIPAGI